VATKRHQQQAAAYLANLAAQAHPAQGPTPSPCVCGADRGQHGGKTQQGAHKPTNCTRYRSDVPVELAWEALWADARRDITDEINAYQQRQRDRAVGKRAEGEWGVGPSDASSCPRKIQYRERPPEGFIPLPEDKRAAAVGTAIHEAAAKARKATYPWREHEVRIDVPGLDRQGAFDEYDPITATLIDWKTRGEWTWDRDGQSGPPEEEWEQAMIYALALIEQGKPVRTVKIEAVNRENGRNETHTRNYDEAFARRGLAKLVGYATALDAGLDLPRTRSGPTDDPLCKRCSARVHCWNMDAAVEAGRSPEGWTLIHDDADAEYALQTYDAARDAEKEAATAKREARVLLDGLTKGEYGEMILGWKGGNAKAPEPDAAARLAQLEALWDAPQRPPLDDLPYPTKGGFTAVSIDVKRKRVATLARDTKTLTPPHEAEEATA
jgi:hypothetical protein